MRDQSAYSKHRQIPFTNSSGEVIPAFGAVEITGADTDGVLTVTKPTSGVKDYLLASNGHHDVAIGEKGSLTYTNPAWVLYDSGSPANGERWASKSATFKLELTSPETGPFMILGGANGTRVFCGPAHLNCPCSTSTTTTTTTIGAGGNCSNCTDSIAADSWQITVSGVADGSCSGCSASFNGTFCLEFISNCIWQEPRVQYRCSNGVQCPGPTPKNIYTLSFSGGNATLFLFMSTDCASSFQVATYQASLSGWDCQSPKTLGVQPNAGTCTSLPLTIEIRPSNCGA